MKRTLPLTALAAAALVAAGCGSSNNNNKNSNATPAASKTPVQSTKTPAKAQTASKGPVKVELNEWKIIPSATVLKAGKVTFDVTNTGKLPHEMIVIRTNKHAASLGHGSRVSEKGSIGEVEGLAAGKSEKKNFTLKKGHYVLICNITGHYMAGMHTDLVVQ